jgi:endonuclease/exonuclease/phosphatase family metal-dependent hydrolase
LHQNDPTHRRAAGLSGSEVAMRLRIATLNAWALPAPLSVRPEERMAALAARLCALDVDVVALQEMWTRPARREVREACASAGFVHTWSTHAELGGSGLFVMSRLPLAAARFEGFAVRGYPERVDHGDYYGGKGFVRIEIRHPEGAVGLVSTHLHARYDGDIEHAYVPQRIAQIVQLSCALQSGELPTLLVGDLNFTEQNVEHQVLTGLTGLRDLAVELDHRQATALRTNPYRAPSRADRRIDYVFARDGAHARVAPRALERVLDDVFRLHGSPASVSDHAGLLAEVEIAPGPGRAPAPPDPAAVAAAREWLSRGRADAARRRQDARAVAGAGLACAGAFALGRGRVPALSRRRFVRGGLYAAALLALPPWVGLSLFSEIDAPDQIRAFELLSQRLEGRGDPAALAGLVRAE